MEVSDMINAAASLMGHIPTQSRGIQKNVADDVMMKVLEMMSIDKYSECEMRRLLNNLTVDKFQPQSQEATYTTREVSRDG